MIQVSAEVQEFSQVQSNDTSDIYGCAVGQIYRDPKKTVWQKEKWRPQNYASLWSSFLT